LDPDPVRWSIRIRIRILVCEIFVKFSNTKSECTFKGHFCAEIDIFMWKIVFFPVLRIRIHPDLKLLSDLDPDPILSGSLIRIRN